MLRGLPQASWGPRRCPTASSLPPASTPRVKHLLQAARGGLASSTVQGRRQTHAEGLCKPDQSEEGPAALPSPPARMPRGKHLLQAAEEEATPSTVQERRQAHAEGCCKPAGVQGSAQLHHRFRRQACREGSTCCKLPEGGWHHPLCRGGGRRMLRAAASQMGECPAALLPPPARTPRGKQLLQLAGGEFLK